MLARSNLRARKKPKIQTAIGNLFEFYCLLPFLCSLNSQGQGKPAPTELYSSFILHPFLTLAIMGRQAKLRQQRKQSTQPAAEPKPASKLAQSHSVKSNPSRPPQKQSAIGKFFNRLNPFSKEEDYGWLEDEQDFTEANNQLMGAVAWEGFQEVKRGFVFVEESEGTAPQLDYISRRYLKKTLRQKGVDAEGIETIDEMVGIYKPKEQLVMVYLHQNKEITASIPPLDKTPPEYYRLIQEEE